MAKKNNIIITDPVMNSNIDDLKKTIEYRNKFFLNEIKKINLFYKIIYKKNCNNVYFTSNISA